MMMPYCSGGDVAHYLRHSQQLSETVARPLVSQLCSAIEYLHTRNILHRDLKLSNLLLTGDQKTLYLSDFGLAIQLQGKEEQRHTRCGTPNFIAPEILTESMAHGFPADMWSLGCILFAILTGESPFEGLRVR